MVLAAFPPIMTVDLHPGGVSGIPCLASRIVHPESCVLNRAPPLRQRSPSIKHRLWLICILVLLAGLSACVPSHAPTSTHAPPTPTATATTAPTASTCPAGYDPHVDTLIGFSACYPAGWVRSQREDRENQTRWVDYATPASGTGSELKFVSVRVAPRMADSTDDALLKTVAKWLTQEFPQGLITSALLVDGQEAIEVRHEATLVLGREVLGVTAWTAVFLARDQQWEIEVAGRSEFREELERIHDQFLPHFLILTQ